MNSPNDKLTEDARPHLPEPPSAQDLEKRKAELESAIKTLKTKVEERENDPHTF